MHRCLVTFASDTFRVPRLLFQPGECFFAVLSHLNIDRVGRTLKGIKFVKEKLFFSPEQYVLQKYHHPVGILRHSWQGPEICNVMQSFILYGQTVGQAHTVSQNLITSSSMTTVVGILTAQSPSSASSLTSERWST